MSITVNAFLTDLQIQLGDPSGTAWDRVKLLSFLRRAYRIAWPFFFTPVMDDTSYTGVNAVTQNTNELDVPSTFLSTLGVGEVAYPGEITGLEVRLTGTTTPVEPIPQVWFYVSRAAIDDLAMFPTRTPKIRFLSPYNNIFELRLYGASPFLIPTADNTTPLPGSDVPGFLEWLTFQTMVYCMAAKETSNDNDKRGYGRRHLLDQADADKMRYRYRMPKPYYTQFIQIMR